MNYSNKNASVQNSYIKRKKRFVIKAEKMYKILTKDKILKLLYNKKQLQNSRIFQNK